MSQAASNRYLGEEKPFRLLLRFSIPCVMGLLISALYNIVDQIFIGNSELGYLGNAATGVSFPIICIANACAWCVGDGAASFLSILAGRNDTENAHKCVGTGITVTLMISLVLTLVCELFNEPLMRLFGASDQTAPMAVEYFAIVVAFFPLYLLLSVMNSMIRADGSPSYSMVSMLTGAITNILLDPLFIFVFKWGIAGAAWATGIGQLASFVLCVLYFRKPKNFRLTHKSFVPDLKVLRSTILLGAATFVTQISIVVMSLTANIILAQYGALSIYGQDVPISVFSIQTKVYTLVQSVVTGIVLGGQPIFGYNYGARKLNRVRETYRLVLISTLVVTILATLLFQLKPEWIIGIFGSGDDLYMEFAEKTFRIYLLLMSMTCLTKMTAIFFQSIGKSVRAVAASLVRDILCFTPLAILLPMLLENLQPGSGIHGILYAAPIADAAALVVILALTIPFYRSLKDQPDAVGAAEPVIRPSKPGVIITIAREHGSEGKQIGKLVAEKLGIPFYYKEMTALAAQEAGLDKEFVSDINTNSPAILHELYLSTSVIQQAVAAQETIIRRIAQSGSCVIVGRAADWVLKDHPNVVRVFIHAPKEFRISSIMERYGDNRESAAANVRRSDEARAAYYRSISGQTWGDPHHYELCVDASAGRDVCAQTIIRFAGKV